MAKLRVHNIEPSTGTDVAFGTTGDTIAVSSDSLKQNVWKDSGGNTLFQSDGAGTLSNVNSAFPGSGPKLILSQTADASSTISFTSGIDSTYDQYIFVFVNIRPDTNGAIFGFQANADGGSGYDETITSTAFHARHTETDSVAQLSYMASQDQAQGTAYQGLSYDAQNNADDCMGGCLTVVSPSSTTFVKQWYAEVNEVIRNGTGGSSNNFMAGYFNTTSAIDEFSFKMSSGTFEGKIKLYGVT